MKPIVIVAAALLGVVPAAALAESAENYIKYRQGVMKAIGGHMGASTQIVRGRVSPEGHLSMHAQALADLNKDLTSLFPEGSDFGETEAKEEIWDNWEAFGKAAKQSQQATANFAAAVAEGDAEKIAASHRQVGKACKACHEDFRQKDE